ncbi:winged helix DNA-binding protein [Novosphingobium piscinae]|nr:winged helix DNA-binding protein [Novosphingobium piscinae]
MMHVEHDASLIKDLCGVIERYSTRRPMTELENERAIDLAAERVWEARRARAQVIAPHLLGEPGWDMMIDLFIAERQGRVSLVKSVCLASGVPYTTAWRWLRVLEREGLVRLTSDSKDLRRVVVRISESGYAKMFDYFQMMVRDNRCAA